MDRPRRDAGALAGAVTLAALTLRPSSSADTLIGRSTATWQATERYHERFGDDAIYVLVREDLRKLLLTTDLETVLGLEGCLAGNPPSGATPAGGTNGPCARARRTKPAQVVYGPGTFVNEAVQPDRRPVQRADAPARGAGRAGGGRPRASSRCAQGRSTARAKTSRQQASSSSTRSSRATSWQLALKYGLTRGCRSSTTPTSSPRSCSTRRAGGDAEGALRLPVPERATRRSIQVRLKPGLSDASAREAIALVRAAVAMPQWRLDQRRAATCHGRAGRRRRPHRRAQPTRSCVLLVAALVVMALTLALVFRARLRLLPLRVALAAAALTFGALVAARRAADDGLDRRAAGADRPRRRLRDPVPVARAEEARRRARAARLARADDRRPPALATGAGLPRAAALAGADGARLRAAARRRRRARAPAAR